MSEENRPATTPMVTKALQASESLIIERIDKFEANILTAFQELARNFEEASRGEYKSRSSKGASISGSTTDAEV